MSFSLEGTSRRITTYLLLKAGAGRITRAFIQIHLGHFLGQSQHMLLGNSFQYFTFFMLEKFPSIASLTISCFTSLPLVLVSCTMDMSLSHFSRELCKISTCHPPEDLLFSHLIKPKSLSFFSQYKFSSPDHLGGPPLNWIEVFKDSLALWSFKAWEIFWI